MLAMPSKSALTTPSPGIWSADTDYFSKQNSNTSIVFVLPDVIAFDRVKDACNHSFDAIPIRKIKIYGFESYLVEQWIYNRTTKNQIVIYTGNLKDSVVAYRFEIVNDSALWPAAFVNYIEELRSSRHSFPTVCEYGTIFVTNVSQLDASLTLVSVPGGDIVASFPLYVVNHNLKSLSCGSRAATVIGTVAKPIEDKFRAFFHIDHTVSLRYAVPELVCVCQTFLFYYGFMSPKYCDGIYCKKTQEAIDKWWKMISDLKPCITLLKQRPPTCNNGTSIISVIGFTLLVKTLLEFGGNAFLVPKDPLETRNFIQSVQLFQKSQQMHLARNAEGFLDKETLLRLFQWVQVIRDNQNFTKDLSKVKRIVKNTVLDLTSVKALQAFASGTAPSSDSGSSSVSTSHKHKSNLLIDCQSFDDCKPFISGRRLSYLFLGKGKPVNLMQESLAFQYRRDMRLGRGKSHDYGHGHERSNTDLPDSRLEKVSTDRSCQSGQPDLLNTTDGPCAEARSCVKSVTHSSEDTDGAQFEGRLQRRNSIPAVDCDSNVFQTELQLMHRFRDPGSLPILYSHVNRIPVMRRRSRSFSVVEEALETGGTDCFEVNNDRSRMVTNEWLAVQYIGLLRQFKLGVIKKSGEVRHYIKASRMHLLSQVRLDAVLSKYRNSNADHSKVISECNDVRQSLKRSYKVNARLKYEVRLLLQKTKEIETNVKNVEEFKLDPLGQRIDTVSKGLHISPDVIDKCSHSKTPVPEFSWSVLVRKPYLIIFLVFCYLKCLWSVYFGKNDLHTTSEKSTAFHDMFRNTYFGIQPLKKE